MSRLKPKPKPHQRLKIVPKAKRKPAEPFSAASLWAWLQTLDSVGKPRIDQGGR